MNNKEELSKGYYFNAWIKSHGEMIRELRKHSGVTVDVICKKMGISKAYLYDVEKNVCGWTETRDKQFIQAVLPDANHSAYIHWDIKLSLSRIKSQGKCIVMIPAFEDTSSVIFAMHVFKRIVETIPEDKVYKLIDSLKCLEKELE